jgi:hypothetical protein
MSFLLAGLEELWNNSAWQEMVGPEGLSSSSSPVMHAPAVDAAAMQQPGAGAKRGLLEAVLQLSVPTEVRRCSYSANVGISARCCNAVCCSLKR